MILRELTAADEAAFLEALDAWDDDPNFNLGYGLLSGMAFDSYLRVCFDLKHGINLRGQEVPATSYYAFEGNVIVGKLSLRHRFNRALEVWGGHIGYGVLPEFRGKGYATRMLAAALPHAQAVGLNRVLITCNEDNVASLRVIEKNGGVFESVVRPGEGIPPKRRYWISL